MEILQTHNINLYYNENLMINLNIKLLNNNFYEITFIYGDNQKPTHESSELKYIKDELIVKNELTKKMIDFLLMDDTTLCCFTGTKTPKDYKKSIALSLTNFLD